MSTLAGQTYFSTGGAEEEQDVDLVEQGGVQVATNLYKKSQVWKLAYKARVENYEWIEGDFLLPPLPPFQYQIEKGKLADKILS